MEAIEKIIELEKPGVIKEYAPMIKNIKDNIPLTLIDSENFYKSSSQYKNAILDITDLTPISSLRHVLAVITQTRQAIESAEILLKRKYLERERAFVRIESIADVYDQRNLEIDIEEIDYLIQDTEQSLRGAIRKLNFMITQYKNILNELGVDHITEEEFENNEIRHHIMTAFFQSLTAARSRGGIIDEGNHIYLFQLGINGAAAQSEVLTFLTKEEQIFANGGEPSHEMVVEWLNYCADKYMNNGIKFAQDRHMVVLDKSSLIDIKEITR